MRWVDRGPEPGEVAEYSRRFTQGWIDHFKSRTTQRPSDFLWVVFRPALASRTDSICWYCERVCDVQAESGGRAPTVDHFRPLRRFSHLAYEWSNWVFSCYACNTENKRDTWPDSGLVDPCAAVTAERPEEYFDYDTDTGEIVPKDGLSKVDRRRAVSTIDTLGLNRLDVRLYRSRWTLRFNYDVLELPASKRQAFVEFMTGTVPYAGTTRIVVEQMRQAGQL